jgi:hypothetical protein
LTRDCRYAPRSANDLLRAGRIIGLRLSAVDSLRLSMDPTGHTAVLANGRRTFESCR